jgi:hypothetical protein
MVHVASSQRSCEDEAEDGRVDVTYCIILLYLKFTVFTILGPESTLVFWLSL